MTEAVRIVFETHSLTIDNEQGIATGWLGGRLSERGRSYAADLGERRRDDGIDVVYSSDLARSVETVDVAFGASAIPVLLDWRLREIDYGALNGAPVEMIEQERARRVAVPFPGGESYREAVARVGRFLDDVRDGTSGADILVVGHTATRWALDHLLDGRPLEGLVAAPFDWREGWEYVTRAAAPAAGAPA